MTRYLFVFLFLFVFQNCNIHQSSGSDNISIKSKGFIGTDGQSFIDPSGREIILHGINVVNKDPNTHYLGHVVPEDFRKFR